MSIEKSDIALDSPLGPITCLDMGSCFNNSGMYRFYLIE